MYFYNNNIIVIVHCGVEQQNVRWVQSPENILGDAMLMQRLELKNRQQGANHPRRQHLPIPYPVVVSADDAGDGSIRQDMRQSSPGSRINKS